MTNNIPPAGIWKSAQRDWLVARLRDLIGKWFTESEAHLTVFSPDEEVDRTAKARTGGCARELNDLLKEML